MEDSVANYNFATGNFLETDLQGLGSRSFHRSGKAANLWLLLLARGWSLIIIPNQVIMKDGSPRQHCHRTKQQNQKTVHLPVDKTAADARPVSNLIKV